MILVVCFVEEWRAIPQQGCEREEKNDEEEWGRIPIPQSDDSEDSTGWDDPEIEEDDDSHSNLHILCVTLHKGKNEQENKMSEESLAFLLGPRRDGIIRRKDGTLLNIPETLNQAHNTHSDPSLNRASTHDLPPLCFDLVSHF